jgi:hypothetical protein
MAIAGVCRFCGCTDQAPCLLTRIPGAGDLQCFWVDYDRDLCSNPECVEKAYREASAKVP